MENKLKISVRTLVEFVMRSGDIDTAFFSNTRAIDGIEAHKKVQSSYGEGYKKEVSIKCSTYFQDIEIQIEGRIDGVYEGERTLIDEIKSTTRNLEELDYDSNPLHWAQAKAYGYMYAKEKELDEVDIQLTYYNIDSTDTKTLLKTFTSDELKDFFFNLINKYVEYSRRIVTWNNKRDSSIKELKFPFNSFRKGQRDLSVAFYNSIVDKLNLFAEAPTGIGKSISTIFPAIKAMGEGLCTKIFYLTARGTQAKAAEDTVFNMLDKGLEFKHLKLTAKEKICLNDEVKCNPRDCPYAKGHFDRVNDAIIDLFDSENFYTRDIIEKYSKLHMVCPFEFQLDMALFSDMITGDYNYVFNPRVYLRRFFEVSSDSYLFLIDEAHNLVDRGRDMYSAEISKDLIEELYKFMPEKFKSIRTSTTKILAVFDDIEDEFLNNRNINHDVKSPDKLLESIKRLCGKMEKFLAEQKEEEHYDEILNIYFRMREILKISEFYSENFVTLYERELTLIVKILCLDTGNIFKDILNYSRSGVFFSATLTPIKYYKNLLGGRAEDRVMKIESPFDSKKELVLHGNNISTKYRDRAYSIDKVVNYLKSFSSRKGNYLFFFPSYEYMNQVYERYSFYDFNTIIQTHSMSEEERREFLNRFKYNEDIRGFAVMGGIFSEGIDLIGERLVGAAIISVGLPKFNYTRNIIRDFYNRKNGRGYEYAYIYPGIMKTIQSAGRVIRSSDDKGVILLIDNRFAEEPYRSLLPKYWNVKSINSERELARQLNGFWKYWDGEREVIKIEQGDLEI